MAFLTALELENIANQYFDYFIKNKILDQSIQDKPLLKAMRAKQKTFPGGKENIHGNVKFEHSVAFSGYEGDEAVDFGNPANVKQFSYPWKELHGGIKITHSELKKAGITVVDSAIGENLKRNSQESVIRITSLMDDKMQDMSEGLMESLNEIMWRDGTQDAKVFPGLLSFIVDDPTTGIAGGIDRASQAKWRNLSKVGASLLTASRTNQTITRTLRQDLRQLTRYGGKPDLWLCGSTAIEALEIEVFEKGNITETGFTNAGQTNFGMADIRMGNIVFRYDPTLDDLGFADRVYAVDTRHIYPMVMDGQDMKKHNPARPAERYVLYRSVTWTGGMVADMLNGSGVWQLATA